MYGGFGDIAKMNPPRRTVSPDTARSALYDRYMPAFDAAYEGLRNVNSMLADLRKAN
jgi:sugar (pentulose or hexulose) kinase